MLDLNRLKHLSIKESRKMQLSITSITGKGGEVVGLVGD